jgi:hypothetical protein
MRRDDNTNHREDRGRVARASHAFSFPALQCYIVTMANRLPHNPLSAAAGAGSRLILAGAVLAVVWLSVIWALS